MRKQGMGSFEVLAAVILTPFQMVYMHMACKLAPLTRSKSKQCSRLKCTDQAAFNFVK